MRRAFTVLSVGRLHPLWWVPISLAFIAVDTVTGNTMPPPVYALVIMVAAWLSGARVAGPMAVILPFVRFYSLDPSDPQVGPARFTISILVLLLIAVIGDRLAEHERELRARIKALESLLPMCMFCKSIRDDEDKWQRLEAYMTKAGTTVTHGICPTCAAKEGWTV